MSAETGKEVYYKGLNYLAVFITQRNSKKDDCTLIQILRNHMPSLTEKGNGTRDISFPVSWLINVMDSRACNNIAKL